MTAPAPMPKAVKVLGQRFIIGEVEGLKLGSGEAVSDHPTDGEWVHVPEITDVLGICDSDAQVIAIEKDQGFDRKRETFLHENVHAIFAVAGLRDTLGDGEEAIVKRISPILLLWLRDNPRAVAFLTARPGR